MQQRVLVTDASTLAILGKANNLGLLQLPNATVKITGEIYRELSDGAQMGNPGSIAAKAWIDAHKGTFIDFDPNTVPANRVSGTDGGEKSMANYVDAERNNGSDKDYIIITNDNKALSKVADNPLYHRSDTFLVSEWMYGLIPDGYYSPIETLFYIVETSIMAPNMVWPRDPKYIPTGIVEIGDRDGHIIGHVDFRGGAEITVTPLGGAPVELSAADRFIIANGQVIKNPKWDGFNENAGHYDPQDIEFYKDELGQIHITQQIKSVDGSEFQTAESTLTDAAGLAEKASITQYVSGGADAQKLERFIGGAEIETFFNSAGEEIGKLFFDAGQALKEVQLGSRKVGAADVGELFGSFLGREIGNGNQLAEITASTVLGLTLSKLGDVLEVGFSGDVVDAVSSSFNKSTQELGTTLSGDILGRLGGVGSSILASELADALDIKGFEGQLLSTAVSGVSSQVIKTSLALMQQGKFDIPTLFNNVGLQPANMALSIGNSFAGVFGTYAASKIISPESPEAAVFGSAGSALGALAGTAATNALFWGIPFVGPFVGAFLGNILSTWAANALVDNDDLARVSLGVSTVTGRLAAISEATVDHGDIRVAQSISNSVVSTVNTVLNDTGMYLDLDSPFTVDVGYYNNSKEQLWAFAGTHQEFYRSSHGIIEQALVNTAQSAVDQVIDRITVLGGDTLMRRAFYNSRASSSGDDSATQLGFDLQTAKDYRFYLDHEKVIKDAMKAQPKSAFTAGWVATLKHVGELGLNKGSSNDFKEGFYANLKDIDAIQGPRADGAGFAPERLAWIPDLDASDVKSGFMKTGSLLLSSPDGRSTVTVDDVFGPGKVASLTGADNTNTVNAHSLSASGAAAVLVKAGNGDKLVYGHLTHDTIIVAGSGKQTLQGEAGNDWLRAGNGTVKLIGNGGDDLLVAGTGNPILDGGTGRNTYYLGEDNADVQISAIDPTGSDTVVATLAGARVSHNGITITARGTGNHAVYSSKSGFARSGADLVVTTVSGTASTADPTKGKVVVKNFFLTDSGIDSMSFSDGTIKSNKQLWEAAGVTVRVDQTVWNSSDSSNTTSSVDTTGSSDVWFSKQTTRTASGKVAFDARIDDDGTMITTGYDPSDVDRHDWRSWFTRYAADGAIASETITFDDGSAVVAGVGGAVAGDVGDDTLRGTGAGTVMIGDRGDDTYWIDSTDDRVYERANGGDDVVRVVDTAAAVDSFTLGAGQSVETLVAVNSAGNNLGTGAVNIAGNDLVNTLQGNQGANALNGGGGADRLEGFDGDDSYIVDNQSDVVIEADDGGTDTVRTSVGYTLAASQEIEKLVTTDASGTGAINLTGNGFANALYGNAGSNVLDGGGGADALYGYGGDDGFVVDNAGDRAIEAAGAGNDTVRASVDYALAAGTEIETLRTTNDAGTGGIDLTGNEFDTIVHGNAGNNILDGGAGGDTLYGHGGADTFAFRTALNADNLDHIADYAGGDHIRLSKSVFTALTAASGGTLDAHAFKDITSSAVLEADDRILYNHNTGALSYDADGSGTAKAVQFAVLNNHAALSFTDFLIA